MLGRHVYRVRPLASGTWQVEKEGDRSRRGERATVAEARDFAVALARADEPSRVIIEDRGGAIVDERLFGKDDADVTEDKATLGE
jgi:hypothetical protein